jgi:methyl-accepting chemotaxis protein
MAADTNARRLEDHRLLSESLGLLAPVAHDVVAAFYEQLFIEYPQVRSMFPASMEPQQDKLLKAIIALVTHYDRPDQLTPALTALGRNHLRYGAELGHYAAVGGTLMSVLRRYAGDAWNAEYEGAWQRAYTWAAGTMMMSAVDAAEVEVTDRMAA